MLYFISVNFVFHSLQIVFNLTNSADTDEMPTYAAFHLCLPKFAVCTILPAKSDSDVMFCLQCYQGLRIDRSLLFYPNRRIGLIHKLSIYLC